MPLLLLLLCFQEGRLSFYDHELSFVPGEQWQLVSGGTYEHMENRVYQIPADSSLPPVNATFVARRNPVGQSAQEIGDRIKDDFDKLGMENLLDLVKDEHARVLAFVGKEKGLSYLIVDLVLVSEKTVAFGRISTPLGALSGPALQSLLRNMLTELVLETYSGPPVDVEIEGDRLFFVEKGSGVKLCELTLKQT